MAADCISRSGRCAPSEIALAADWAAAEGWNPGLSDAACFATVDAAGFLIGELDGKPAATISCVNYDDRFAFLGFYIVRPDLRGRGYGCGSGRPAIAHAGARTIGLDGVVAQQENYRKSGFTLAYRNIRYGGRVAAGERAAGATSRSPTFRSPIVAADDATVFPAPRDNFLRAWIGTRGHVGRALMRDGALAAWGVIRPCRAGFKIGPLVADDRAAAEAVFDALIAAVGGGEVFLDVPEANRAAVALARVARPCAGVRDRAHVYRAEIRDVASPAFSASRRSSSAEPVSAGSKAPVARTAAFSDNAAGPEARQAPPDIKDTCEPERTIHTERSQFAKAKRAKSKWEGCHAHHSILRRLALLHRRLIVPALAQEKYPNRPVQLRGELRGRRLERHHRARAVRVALASISASSSSWRTAPGGSGNVGAASVINSPPDGYTVMFVGPNNAISQSVFKKLPFDFMRDTAPVGGIMTLINIMVVPPSLPVKTVAEFIAYAKANPGTINMASPGAGTSPHLSGELFKMMTGIEMQHIPYRGAGPAYPDLMTGKTQVFFDNLPGSVELVKTGKLQGARRHVGEALVRVSRPAVDRRERFPATT